VLSDVWCWSCFPFFGIQKILFRCLAKDVSISPLPLYYLAPPPIFIYLYALEEPWNEGCSTISG
jgi:hypothetical protein